MRPRYIFSGSPADPFPVDDHTAVETVCSKASFHEFCRVPALVSQGDPRWVPPIFLEMDSFFQRSNRFWSHAQTRLFVLRRRGVCTGRIAAFVDASMPAENGRKVGLFGFFECGPDPTDANALFGRAAAWLRSCGCSVMRGPINGRIDMGCGFLVQGPQHPPLFPSTYSPPYYTDLALQFGMCKAKDLHTYDVDLSRTLPTSTITAPSQVTIRPFSRLRAGRDLASFIPLFLASFSQHYGYVPVEPEEVRMRFGINHLRWFVDRRLFSLAESDGRLVGFLWSFPDYYQAIDRGKPLVRTWELLRLLVPSSKIRQGKLFAIGVASDFRGYGIAEALNDCAFLEMRRRGYVHAEIGWIDEDNPISHQIISTLAAPLSAVHRIYEVDLP